MGSAGSQRPRKGSQGPEKGRGPGAEGTQRPHGGRKGEQGILAVQSEDNGDLHPSVAMQRSQGIPWRRQSRAGVQGFLGPGG